MRITNSMLINNMLSNIGSNLTRMDKYQMQLATGKRISVPSDDPIIASRALKLRTDVSEVQQYQRNIKDTQSWMDVTESTVGQLGDVIQRVRELAVQGSNGSETPGDLLNIQSEVKQLREQIVHIANTTYAGRYVFSGYKTDKPLMKDSGPFAGYFNVDVANNEDIKYDIGIGDDINVNVLGGDLFNGGGNAIGFTSGSSTGSALAFSPSIDISGRQLNISIDSQAFAVNFPAGSIYNNISDLCVGLQNAINGAHPASIPNVSVAVKGNALSIISGSDGTASKVNITGGTASALIGFAAPAEVDGTNGKTGLLIQDMDKLINALGAGDGDTVGKMITNFDNQMDNVLRVRADLGARTNRVELTANRLDNDNITFTKLMSDNEDVDMAEAIMNLKNEENVYRSSLAGGARVIQPTLLDFLR